MMMIKKIAIIGNAGSGKSTLALQLHKKLSIPLYHLDQYYWNPGWQRVDADEFVKIHTSLCDQSEWIIDGSGQSVLRYRIEKADCVIFLDVPRYLCLWRVIKRAVLNLGKEIPVAPKGCKQQIFTSKFLDFLQWIWHFNKKYRLIIDSIFNDVKNEKKIYIVRSVRDVEELVQSIMR